MRIIAFGEALQDLRALELLESFIGREKVVELLHEWGLKGYNTYKRGGEALITFREKINQEIKKYL